ncbi:hypothetical protein N0V93_008402 [Gnomoniopsis smithogilvyi]|uniref:Peptidase S54 rhomboid domain-containing protein n=1 Tax=Gnomoniopsis smithogilvyi TaxID=1191159 RepID=A0A9W8YLN0_9PEZI|nr:hypothetical protein N0V93_008402 [Gnomoniopsis smithogilvyi]
MSASRYAVQTLKWSAIGTNLYIFGKWNVFRPPIEAKRDGKYDPNSRAYIAAQLLHQRYMFDNFTISRRNVDEGRWYTMLTSALSHKDLTHLAVNMFMLHQATSIGTYVGLGPIRLATLALGSALGGSVGALYDNTQRIRAGEPDVPGLGASGMVQGMLVATMLAAPRLPMQIFFIPIDISYRAVVGGFLAWDMYKLYEERRRGDRKKSGWSGSYVGYAAHLGGAAFGAAFYLVAMRRGRPMPRIRSF